MKKRTRKLLPFIAASIAAIPILPAYAQVIQTPQKITMNSGVGIRTLKNKALRNLKNALETWQNVERGQTFGDHLDAAQKAYNDANDLMNANPADYPAVDVKLELANQEIAWLSTNDPKRVTFLLRKRELNEKLLDTVEQLNVTLAEDEGLKGIAALHTQAVAVFNQGDMDKALSLADSMDKALAKRQNAEADTLVSKAKELVMNETWDEALSLLKRAQKLAPKHAAMLELMTEVRQHAVTTLSVIAVIGDREVPAQIHVDGEWEKLPFVRDIPKDSKVSLRLVYVEEQVGYFAASAEYTCNWTGEKQERIELKPVTGPAFRKDWTLSFGKNNDVMAEMTMCYVRAGNFTMGQPGGDQNGELQHPVELRDNYWIGKCEVTQKQWLALMENNPSFNQGNPQFPVDNISWDDAMLFCRKLTNHERLAGRLPEGYIYTLPTEAQWEYACRAGNQAAFSFGDDDLVLSLYGNTRGTEDGHAKVAPVAQFRANAFGLHDMHGNLSEWCSDLYATYPAGKAIEPTGPVDAETLRVHRGGDWSRDSAAAHSAARDFSTPSFHDECIGFRVALVKVK